MTRSTLLRGFFWLIAIGVTIGCGRSDAPGESTTVRPIVAREQPQNEPAKSADAREETKSAHLAAGGSFAFPADEGGKILSRILPPSKPAALSPLPSKSASERPLPAFLAAPDATGTPTTLAPKPFPQPPRTAPRPMPLNDRVPIELAQREIDRPEVVVLPVGGLTKIDALDLKKPVHLPILARPTADRASLEDPTTEFTARSILNDNLPLRVTMALFVKVNLPEPFENAEPAKVKITIPDDPAKALGNPPLPRP